MIYCFSCGKSLKTDDPSRDCPRCLRRNWTNFLGLRGTIEQFVNYYGGPIIEKSILDIQVAVNNKKQTSSSIYLLRYRLKFYAKALKQCNK